METQLSKRLKSFSWRVGMMVAALVLDQASQAITGFGFGPQVTVVLGLILAEFSKALRAKVPVEPTV